MQNKKLKILIADDEDGLRLSMAGIIEMEGHEVFTAVDGYEAIELAKHNSFDIAFLDIKMPGINGVETFKEIKKLTPETVVVMMTAYAVQHLIKEAINEGAYACLNKPFDMDKIMETIKDVSKKPFMIVIENDTNLCLSLNKRFKELGYNVATRASGAESLALAQRKAPDVVFLDITNDKGTALETLKKMKESLVNGFPKIIVLGNDPADPIMEEIRKFGPAEFTQKPHNPDEIKSSIDKTLGKDKKLKIYLADDDRMLCDSLKDYLTQNGYEVETAYNGDEVIKKMVRDASKDNGFKIVILDVRLPGVNGLEIYDQIKQANPGVGVIFISGLNQDDGLNNAISRNNYSYLHKPFDPDSLIRLIEHIKENKLKKNT